VPARGTVQVWTAGQELLLRDAHRVGDSLVGYRPYADTARSAVALGSVDSLRVQSTDLGKTLIVGTGVAIALVLAYAEGLQGMD
jgi:chromosome condensin MukBEF ATPase and DNA-binding subunit MukB